jgi:hypothetical protein
LRVFPSLRRMEVVWPIVDEYLADLAASVAAVRAGAGTPSRTPVVY